MGTAEQCAGGNTTRAAISAGRHATERSHVYSARPLVRDAARIQSATRSVRSHVHHAVRSARGPAHIKVDVSFLALYHVTWFRVPSDARRSSFADISAHLPAERPVQIPAIARFVARTR